MTAPLEWCVVVTIERLVAPIGGRRVIALLGTLFAVLSTLWAVVRGTEGEPVVNVLIAFALSAGPGLVLL